MYLALWTENFAFSLYNDIFTALQPQLSKLVQDMQPIEMVSAHGYGATYRIRKNQMYGGSLLSVTHHIYFSQDQNGLWKIDKF